MPKFYLFTSHSASAFILTEMHSASHGARFAASASGDFKPVPFAVSVSPLSRPAMSRVTIEEASVERLGRVTAEAGVSFS